MRSLALAVSLSLAAASCASLPGFFKRGDGEVVTTKEGACVRLTPENALHEVGACDRRGVYQVKAPGRGWTLPGRQVRDLARERVLRFAQQTPYPWKTLEKATVELWLVAPVFAPDEAYVVAAVTGPGGNFALPLDLEPSRWQVDPSRVLWLGRESYPSAKAKLAGRLAVAARNDVPAGALRQAVAKAGLAMSEDGYVAVLTTPTFGEADAAKRLAAAGSVVQSIDFVPASEPEGARAAVFRFPFNGK